MSITFKQFNQVIELSDEEFQNLLSEDLSEGLSDMPGFGWLKNIGNDPAKKKAALAKIEAERERLKKLKDAKSKQLDQALAAFAAGEQKHKGAISHDDLTKTQYGRDQAMNARMDRHSGANLAHRERNMGRA
jgi:hypothetical protein